MVNLTVQSVQSCRIALPQEENPHRKRVAQAIGQSIYRYEEYEDTINRLTEIGFRLFVHKGIFKQFRYCAGLKGSYIKSNPFYRETIDFVGDIPDFVLDNMDKIRGVVKMPNSRFTIHSHQPLPVTASKIYTQVDPVMVYWLRREWAINWTLPEGANIGVVIGVWDNDKELEI